jgi:DNA (cytosine-5)-methyltransferase 1
LYREYSKVVSYLKPPLFIFENVLGLLSAKPDGKPIVEDIRKDFKKAGYIIPEDLSKCVIDTSEYGVPQVRKRVIIIGVREDLIGDSDPSVLLRSFYEDFLFKRKSQKKTVRDAISKLPPLYPLKEVTRNGRRKYSHDYTSIINGHLPRFHNKRDIEIFKLLIEDIDSGRRKYDDKEELKKLYSEKTGKSSAVHKYHVLEWDKPSTTIVAHLYKDGLRHIHPDSKQRRSITVREAASIQTFPEDYKFVCSMGNNYKMIGNAVPPKFAKVLGICISDYLTDIIKK